MSASLSLSRRSFFSLAAGGVMSARVPTVDQAMATGPVADGSGAGLAVRPLGTSLEVAGPRDGALGAWARQVQAALAADLALSRGGAPLTVRYRGGVDGVIAANQFDARAMPDGQAALLFSGSVMLAWLAGDDRVRLDPAHMLPVMAAYGPGVLMVRGGLTMPSTRGGSGQAVVRLAVGPEPDAAVTAMLGLDLLGIPVMAVRSRSGAMALAREGHANAVFLHGPGCPPGIACPCPAASGLRSGHVHRPTRRARPGPAWTDGAVSSCRPWPRWHRRRGAGDGLPRHGGGCLAMRRSGAAAADAGQCDTALAARGDGNRTGPGGLRAGGPAGHSPGGRSGCGRQPGANADRCAGARRAAKLDGGAAWLAARMRRGRAANC